MFSLKNEICAVFLESLLQVRKSLLLEYIAAIK